MAEFGGMAAAAGVAMDGIGGIGGGMSGAMGIMACWGCCDQVACGAGGWFEWRSSSESDSSVKWKIPECVLKASFYLLIAFKGYLHSKSHCTGATI